jgi:hypothetical protein
MATAPRAAQGTGAGRVSSVTRRGVVDVTAELTAA